MVHNCVLFVSILIVSLLLPYLDAIHRRGHELPKSENQLFTGDKYCGEDYPTEDTPPPLPTLKPFVDDNRDKDHPERRRSFGIDYKRNCFVKDGEPWRYVSGSIHYFRVPREKWRERLAAARLGGLNAIQTYIEWASHEPEENVYDFSGMLNFTEYFEYAQQLGFVIILRLGPFIASERDNMGLPYWLSAKHANIRYRTSDQWYLYYVRRWFDVLLPKLRPMLYENGGPIVMAQVENEYGSFYTHDIEYMSLLRDTFRSHLGARLLLFTVDGPSYSLAMGGHVPGVYSTVDFGAGANKTEVEGYFEVQRGFEPRGPLVNTEYYPGWFDTWGTAHQTVAVNETIATLSAMFSMNASVNIYMYHGGTSFGFMNGAYINNRFKAMVTSYDYDAPISDNGELKPKYFAIRNLIRKYYPDISPGLAIRDADVWPILQAYSGETGLKTIRPQMRVSKSMNENELPETNITIIATAQIDIFELMRTMRPIVSRKTLSFEQLAVRHGFVHYQTVIGFRPSDPVLLNISGDVLHDRALVFVNNIYRGTLSRQEFAYQLPLSDVRRDDTLGILVENQGHTCCGMVAEQKGLLSAFGNVTLGGVPLFDWQHYKLFSNWTRDSPVNPTKFLKAKKFQFSKIYDNINNHYHQSSNNNNNNNNNDQKSIVNDANDNRNNNNNNNNDMDCGCGTRDLLFVPTFYEAILRIGAPLDRDLFLDTSYCGRKGVAYVNGFPLGRYWPTMGPQVTLYVPRAAFHVGDNRLTLFELQRDYRPCMRVFLTDRHVINGTTPDNYDLDYMRQFGPVPNKTSGLPHRYRPYPL